MFTCPNCQDPLARVRGERGVYWSCPGCRGSHVSLPVLRQVSSGPALRELWSRAVMGEGRTGRPCATCTRPMREIDLAVGGSPEPLVLDVCLPCQFLWFDPGERERLPGGPVAPVAPDPHGDLIPDLSSGGAVRAQEELEAFAQSSRARESDGPVELTGLQTILTFFVPVEETHPVVHPPVVTWTVLALITLFSVVAFGDLERAVFQWGFIPGQWERLAGLTLLTSFFVHGGLLHLLGNLYFLYVTGDNVEDFLGPKRFVLLLVLATIAGAVAHGLVDSIPDRPCVGASGGISGVMAFYALRFPRAKLHIRFFLFFVFRFPFWGWFLFWVAIQFTTASQQFAGISEVSGAAHLGGAICGAVLWGIWKQGRLAL